jgi:YD repeat-containing protein
VTAVDRYTNLTGLTYSTTTPTIGGLGFDYLRTTYAYDNKGQVDRVVSPTGTITLFAYDGFARLTGTWVGTDDTTTNGLKWTPANASPTSNMVQVAASEYDNGGVGNGNLTHATEFPGGSDAPRITHAAYDWRNRLVATKTGVTDTPSTEAASVNRPISYTKYDNLSRITGQRVYDGDGVTIVDANSDGVPDMPAAGLLRGRQTLFYDSYNRVYRGQEHFVDQYTGAVGTQLTTDVFYDRRGNVAAVSSPNSPVMQARYDGASRLTSSFIVGNIPTATWASATSLSTSIVVEQNDWADSRFVGVIVRG